MNDITELKERAEKLMRQISLFRTELRADDINKKADSIVTEIRELRDDNGRLTRENNELKDSLYSLITSIEDIRISEFNETVLAVGKKMDAMLGAARTGHVPLEVESAARLAVVADPVDPPSQRQEEASARTEPKKLDSLAILQRRPGD